MISSGSNYDVYGVVVDGKTKAIDIEKTKPQRTKLAK